MGSWEFLSFELVIGSWFVGSWLLVLTTEGTKRGEAEVAEGNARVPKGCASSREAPSASRKCLGKRALREKKPPTGRDKH